MEVEAVRMEDLAVVVQREVALALKRLAPRQVVYDFGPEALKRIDALAAFLPVLMHRDMKPGNVLLADNEPPPCNCDPPAPMERKTKSNGGEGWGCSNWTPQDHACGKWIVISEPGSGPKVSSERAERERQERDEARRRAEEERRAIAEAEARPPQWKLLKALSESKAPSDPGQKRGTA